MKNVKDIVEIKEIKEDRREIEYRGNPKRDLVRAYNIRESELSYLGSKRIINMELLEIADKYRGLFERSQLKASGDNLSMIRYGVRIDGNPTPKGDPRLDAIQTLNYVHRVVGEKYTKVLQKIVGEGYTLKQFANLMGISARKASSLLKEALHFASAPLGLSKIRHTIRA